MTADGLLNDFAIRSFRDVADGDYIVARMAYRSGLAAQCLWASQQAIEKYLKCILFLNRIPAREVKHDLGAAMSRIENSGKVGPDLTKLTQDFIRHLDTYGRFRYLETSYYLWAWHLPALDRAVWEVRRYCTLSDGPRNVKLQGGLSPNKVRLPCGYLEKIIDDAKSPARGPLLWQNAFFGKRARKKVAAGGSFHATNSPLSLHPEIVDEVLRYTYLPKGMKEAYRALLAERASGHAAGEPT
ncbi:MAG TPA: HEPN domain-containing protein [Terriglobia bacterium]|nr:HEPN domain-containing protein [Terriglobia bacterium]